MLMEYLKKDLKKKTVSLIHTRLKILDLNIRQINLFLTEIALWCLMVRYNYLELKSELELGHKFITSSDTEVLIHSLKEWGVEKALNKFEGMWALA